MECGNERGSQMNNAKRFLLPLICIAVFVGANVAAFQFEAHVFAVIALNVVLIGIYMYATRVGRMAFMANFHFMQGNKEQGKMLAQRAFALGAKNPALYLNCAVVLIHEGNAEEAFGYLDKAEELNKDLFMQKSIEITRASCNQVAGKTDVAVALLEAMREKYEYVSHGALSTLGFLYIMQGELEKAKEASEAAIEDKPDANAAWDNLGQIAYRQKDFVRAKECFNKALEIRADFAESLYYMGCISEEEGDEVKAGQYFAKASDAKITHLSTVSVEQVREKLMKYIEKAVSEENI